jgi:glucose/arabinose dehydrogenase
VQAHSAPLQITFYEGNQFPDDYRGDAFVALHGSWNRAKRTGYKVVRVPLDHGRPKGVYEDFLTGFVAPEGNVWGRPVGVTVMKDGSLLVSEDANSSIWRITYNKRSSGFRTIAHYSRVNYLSCGKYRHLLIFIPIG